MKHYFDSEKSSYYLLVKGDTDSINVGDLIEVNTPEGVIRVTLEETSLRGWSKCENCPFCLDDGYCRAHTDTGRTLCMKGGSTKYTLKKL